MNALQIGYFTVFTKLNIYRFYYVYLLTTKIVTHIYFIFKIYGEPKYPRLLKEVGDIITYLLNINTFPI